MCECVSVCERRASEGDRRTDRQTDRHQGAECCDNVMGDDRTVTTL